MVVFSINTSTTEVKIQYNVNTTERDIIFKSANIKKEQVRKLIVTNFFNVT